MTRDELAERTTVEDLRESVGNPVLELLRTYCRPYLHYIGYGILAMLLARIFWLFSPIVLGTAIEAIIADSATYSLPLVPDSWIPEDRLDQLWFSIGLLAVCYVGGSLVYVSGSWVRSLAAYRIQDDVRVDAYKKVQALEYGFFDEQQTGELMSVLNNDVNRLEGFLSGTLQQAGNTTFILLVTSSYMLLLNWQLALVAFIAPAIIGAFNYWYSRVIEPRHQEIRESVGDINSVIQNNIQGIKVIKSYNQEQKESERIEDRSREYKSVSWRVQKVTIAMGQITNVLTDVGTMVVLFVAGYWLIVDPAFLTGSVTAGTIISFFIYMDYFSWPLSQITGIVDSYQSAKASFGRVLGVIERPSPVTEVDDPVDLGRAEGAVDYESVSFSYGEKAVLEDVSLRADPGDFVGVVGPTGAGKSTLVDLLLRLYDVDEGTIRVDGHDVRDVSLDSLRRNVGYVGQDPFLFDATVRENIAYADPDADQDAIERAAHLAGADAFVETLSDGYDTRVGERGVRLSGGQRQRICLARAIYKDPPILILDEATSHVDNETEAIIQSRLGDVIEDRTTFAIAHRLSTVRDADEIVVVDDGEIQERGTHDELLERGGLYADLWNVQVGEVAALPSEFVDRPGSRG